MCTSGRRTAFPERRPDKIRHSPRAFLTTLKAKKSPFVTSAVVVASNPLPKGPPRSDEMGAAVLRYPRPSPSSPFSAHPAPKQSAAPIRHLSGRGTEGSVVHFEAGVVSGISSRRVPSAGRDQRCVGRDGPLIVGVLLFLGGLKSL